MGKISLGSSIIYDSASGGGGTTVPFTRWPLYFASSEFTGDYYKRYAFDDNLSTIWFANGAIGQFIGVDFYDQAIVSKLFLRDTNNRLKDFIFEGSNEQLANYVTLLSTTRPSVTTESSFEIPNIIGYRFYRIRCTGALYSGSNMSMTEIRMEYKRA